MTVPPTMPCRPPAPTGNPPRARAKPIVPGYEVLRELGAGGMGVVYLARQAGLDRTVALKMLKAGVLADDESHFRFAEEARIVARLRHPNVVQLHEFGTVFDLPYLALEYVEGPTLGRFLDGKAQPAPWSADLIELLARAMQYAHEQGVVHRDLKPANILLDGERDPEPPGAADTERFSFAPPTLRSPVPKVLDFGLAKIVGDSPIHTQTGMTHGTPGYMAPEQVRADRDLIGPWTDVYALGVILYECLTGRAPFPGTDPVAMMAATADRDPPPPRRVRPDVPADLETICLKCLAKKPEERYLTAAALAADLARYREGRPILARRAGPAERAWKFARRNPVACGLGAALLASLAVGFAAASALYVRAEERRQQADSRREQAERAEADATAARGRAESAEAKARENEARANRSAGDAKAARERAERDRDKFKAVNQFVINDLVVAPRSDNFGRDVTLRAAVLAASPLVESRFRDHPEVMAEMDRAIGATLRHLGEYEAAEMHLRRSADAHRRLSPRDDYQRLNAVNSLAVVLMSRSKLTEVADLLREVIAVVEAMPAPTPEYTTLLLTARQNLGGVLLSTGKVADGRAMLERLLADHERTDGPDAQSTITVALNLARAYYRSGEKELARRTARDTLARAERGTGLGSEYSAAALRLIVEFWGNDPPTEELFAVARRAAKISDAVYGHDHPVTVAAKQELVIVLWRGRQYGGAEEAARDLLDAASRRFGPGSNQAGYARFHIAASLGKRWRYAEAFRLTEEGRAAAQKWGTADPDAATFEQMVKDMRADRDAQRPAIAAALGVPAAVPALLDEK